jgi:hypothetical protein
MTASLTYERRNLLATYQQFRYAFPDRRNILLETAAEQELKLLTQAFEGRPSYELLHPYPVPLFDLYHAASPFCR